MTEEPDELERAVADTFTTSLSHEEHMLLFGLLHNRGIQFVDGTLWHARTQRGAAACLAGIWKRGHSQLSGLFRWGGLAQADYVHWYRKWAEWDGERRFDHLSAAQLAIVERLEAKLAKHPAVRCIGPDPDDDPDFWQCR